MEIPKISIIVSTYNAEEWLKKVLWGFEQQIFKNFEVIFLTQLLRNNIKNELWESVNNNLLKNKTINDKDLCRLLVNEIKSKNSNRIVIIGYPRTVTQFETFKKAFNKKTEFTGVFLSGERHNDILKNAYKKTESYIELL